MSKNIEREPMLDMFIFETLQLIEQLEQSILTSEKKNGLEGSINEIFRIMHTIKGSSSMMLFNNIAGLAHSLEDIFYLIREEKPVDVDYSTLTDIVLESLDFIKGEIAKIEEGNSPDGDSSEYIKNSKSFLSELKSSNPSNSKKGKPTKKESAPNSQVKFYISQDKDAALKPKNRYKAVIFFEDGCEMENIRAFTVVHNLKDIGEEIIHFPENIVDADESIDIIRAEGFEVVFSSTRELDEVREFLLKTIFLKNLEVECISPEEDLIVKPKKEIILEDISGEEQSKQKEKQSEKEIVSISTKQNVISVNIAKMDKLMDLVGELVISEAMVTQNPELADLPLENFHKAARQLQKITTELQDIVMSIRMVPLSTTFQKMNRIVRDMCKKLNKDVDLEIIGEETEVDKNIIEHISDPLMHIIRNSLDHGIENGFVRTEKGKPEKGKITLEAKNAGGDVWIIVKDDGKGLDRDSILRKAQENGLVHKPESELTDREIYSFIFLPGFSTKEKVTEFSGRGVGMDVVSKNVDKVGGSVIVDSTPGIGTVISIKIPLTLAIIDGMIVKVGESKYTVPTTSIKESFRISEKDVISDPDGNEMVMVRGECYSIVRLHKMFNIKTEIDKINEGIIIMVENESKSICLFADALIGQQQVVVKALPRYIKKVDGIAGCTLLGDGNISLILDIAVLLNLCNENKLKSKIS